MTTIPTLNSAPYVPTGPNKEQRLVEENRTIPNIEKQEARVHRLPCARTSTQGDLFEVGHTDPMKGSFEGEPHTIDSLGPKLAYSAPEGVVFETGLVVKDGKLVQELRDPDTGVVVDQHPKKGCARYEEVSTAGTQESVQSMDIAS